jgi:phosphate-selective porin OprO and OprP
LTRLLQTSTRTAGVLLGLALVTAAAHAQDAKPASDWTKKLTFSSPDGRFTLSLGNRVQARYEHQDFDLASVADIERFRARRVKTAMEGSAFGNVKYKIQANWVGTPILEDAYFQYSGNPWAQVWVGRGKAFFGRQELTSSGKQQFVDRSLFSGRFHPGRDTGVALVGEAPSKVLEYQIGLYNGSGIATNSNDNDDFMTTARVVWHPMGMIALEESSIDYPSRPKIAIGVALLQNETLAGAGASATVVDDSRLAAEFAFKYMGINALAEYVIEDRERTVGSGAATQVDTNGLLVQLGYLFPSQKFEVAGRWALVSPDTAVDNDQTETGVAFSWYISKHDYKLQADYRTVEDLSQPTTSGNREFDEARLQLQIAF